MSFSARHSYQDLSTQLRLDILNMINQNGGHIGGSLSCLDILLVLYFSGIFDLNYDHFILSAGHLAPALYAVLSRRDYFPLSLLDSYSQLGSRLQGHTSADVPGVSYSSGSLGQGLSFAAGLALGDKRHFSICLTTDGEHQEGQIWEAAMFASKYRLGNLINIVDFNQYQIDGAVDDIMPLGDLAQKYIKFGWSVTTIDGHNHSKIESALRKSIGSHFPHCIIARTTIGKGISYMENNPKYHDIKTLSTALYQKALKELQNL